MYGNYIGELFNVIVCGSFCFIVCLYFCLNINIIELFLSFNYRISMIKVVVKKYVIDMLLYVVFLFFE